MRLKYDLRKYLRDTNQSQREFCRRADISTRTLTNMLNGKNVRPTVRQKIRVETLIPNKELWEE